jgi:hypothetical protein
VAGCGAFIFVCKVLKKLERVTNEEGIRDKRKIKEANQNEGKIIIPRMAFWHR